jgi:hypothetical protein
MCDKERIPQGVGQISEGTQTSVIGRAQVRFRVISVSLLLLFDILTALSLGGVRSLFNKSFNHTNTTDNSFSSFKINLVTDLPDGASLSFTSDINNHQDFITMELSLHGQLTFPKRLIPVSFEEKNKTPCNQHSHLHKRNIAISSQTGPGRLRPEAAPSPQ